MTQIKPSWRKIIVVAAAGAVSAGAAWMGFDALDRAFPPPLENAAVTSREVVDRDGQLLRVFATPQGRWRLAARASDVDRQFVRMLVAYEDRRFFEHSGVDPLAMLRAFGQFVTHGRIVSGGSTLSMQVARLIEPREGQGTKADQGLLGFALRCDGSKTDLLYVDGGPASTGTVGHLRMAGNQVFRHAVVNIAEAITAAAEASNIEVSDVDWFVPHQANQRIIRGVGERLGLDEHKVISTVAMHANTSAASIPLALDAAIHDGRIKRGDLVLLEAMGGGLTWGACAFRL